MDIPGYRTLPSATYEIRLKGYMLSDSWRMCFSGMDIECDENCRETILRGEVADQAALHGLLNLIRDTGLELISLNRLKPEHGQT